MLRSLILPLRKLLMPIKLKDFVSKPGVYNLVRYDTSDYGIDVGKTTVFDAKLAWSHSHHYSLNDKRVSDVPRLFFYTMDSYVEPFFKQQKTGIYTTRVSKKKIKDIMPNLQTGKSPDAILKQAKRQGYEGVYYNIEGGLHIVAIFGKIKVTRIA